MNSRILRTASELLHPVLLLFALFLVASGHDEPGGGFSGGLVAAGGYVLYGVAHGVNAAAARLPVSPRSLVGLGVGTALAAGLLAVAAGRPFLTGLWLDAELPLGLTLKVGSPYLFEVGVLLTVTGAVLTVVYALLEEG